MTDAGALPSLLKKRKLLFGEKVSDEQRRSAGEAFAEAGRCDDALEFFARSGAHDQVRRLAESARREGNVPVYLRAKVILKEKPDAAEFEELAARAVETGRPSMAALAYRKAGREEEAAAITGDISGADEQPDVGKDGADGGEMV